jgi:hypothetical protein
MWIPSSVESITTGNSPADGFAIDLGDGVVVETIAEHIDEQGAAFQMGISADDPGDSELGSVRMDWAAVQALADELNALLRGARHEGWI